MARSYTVFGDNIAAQNSATVPEAQIVATTAIRPLIYEFVIGSASAPASQAASWTFKRSTTASTGGTAITPSPVDPGDPASTATAMVAPSMTAPTLGVELLTFALNQLATFRWLPNPGRELKAPATASNGITLLNPVLTAAFNVNFTIGFEE